MAVDLLLYVALGAGWLAGRIVPHDGRWVGRATLGCVGLLLFLLGASFRTAPLSQLVVAVPYALALVFLVLAATAAVAFALRRREPAAPTTLAPSPTGRLSTGALLALALLAGAVVGRAVPVPTSPEITLALYGLLAVVGFGLDLRWAPLRRAWVPITAAVVGALVGASILALTAPLDRGAVFASALAFGWYSLAGPLVATSAGASLGLFAFLANFLRESLTMVFSPRLGRALRGEGLAALGGATAMDTTLYFVVRYGDPDGGSLALASGLVLTAAASVLVPLVLAL